MFDFWSDYIKQQKALDKDIVCGLVPKCQIDTLECTLGELTILKYIIEDNTIKQNEVAKRTGKSLSTVKRIMEILQEKNYIRRVNGKRYGWWEVLIDVLSE